MSRVVPIALQTTIDAGKTRFVWGLRIVRSDDEYFAITSATRPKTVDTDTTYETGLDVQSIVSSAGFAVDNTELQIIDVDELTRASIIAGRWDAAAFTLSLFDWSQPTAGEIVVMTGAVGQIRPRHGHFVTELRDLRQALQQDTTDVVQPDCRYRFGDAKCALDITGPPFTVAKTVGTVTSRYVFSAPGTEIDDYFGAGEVLFTSGLNIGLRFLVSAYASATDTFTLALPTPFTITPGDTFTAIAGCRKNPDACKAHGNYLNYGGEPDKARIDKLLAGAL
jgi:uncharacterized phage protein (TIGR02218 family)